jgi:hypothetical protein
MEKKMEKTVRNDKTRKGAAFAIIFYLLSLLFYLLLAGCRTEADAPETDAPKTGVVLDGRLYGVWRMVVGNVVMEEIRITREAQNSGNGGSFIYGTDYWSTGTTKEMFAGDIVYAANFSETAGIIIIQYWPGHKQVWVDWDNADPPSYMPPRKDSPSGNFYGIYFLKLNAEGTRVFLACTNDQNNNYGPTETKTLAEARAKFTLENIEQHLNLSVGSLQEKAG